jgi:NhaA family Na+:H+ antiporter
MPIHSLSPSVNKKSLRHHFVSPLRDFLNDSRSTGILLIGCTAISIFIANSGSAGWYQQLWSGTIPVISNLRLPGSFLDWINNFFMAFFFVLAATEIKRELLAGELSSFKKAILPFGAAFGGMLIPALIFAAFNLRTAYSHGWGIPTATDIAFSLGAASLLGKRFPVGLKIFLMALAIIDDLGAIIVIALFYGGNVHWLWLGISAILFGTLLLFNKLRIRFGFAQIFTGGLLWFAMLQSGIEASITGVLFAFAMPVPALALIEKAIHKYVNFMILPLFALANTAIQIPAHVMSSLGTSVGLGVFVGLVVGKPVGIFLISRIMVGVGLAHLPANVRWKEVFGMGTLAGIGFTMSIFTTMLAFSDIANRDIAKISILVAVGASVVISYLYFRSIGVRIVKPTILQPEQSKPEVQLNVS